MSNLTDESIVLNHIITLAKKQDDIEVLWLYGSRARKQAQSNSDFDLAVAFKTYLPDPLERRLRPELLTLNWRKTLASDLSIIDINNVPLPLAYTVVQDNTVLYCTNTLRRMTTEQVIMSKWELDYCYHQKHYA